MIVELGRDKPKVGSLTPWGEAETAKENPGEEGIVFVTTIGHGGFWLSDERLNEMPKELRKFGDSSPHHPSWKGWFEEDCEWGAVALAFPEFFTTAHLKEARKMVNYLKGPSSSYR